jgi:WD40 repeat protein
MKTIVSSFRKSGIASKAAAPTIAGVCTILAIFLLFRQPITFAQSTEQQETGTNYIVEERSAHNPVYVADEGSTDWSNGASQLATLGEHADEVSMISFSPDGSLLATSVGTTQLYDCGIIRFWAMPDGKYLGKLPHPTSANFFNTLGFFPDSTISSIAFSPDGSTFASGSADKLGVIWNVQKRKWAAKLKGHSKGITKVAYSPDGQMLATGSKDSTVRLWKVADGSLITTLEGHKEQVTDLAFTPAGDLIVSAGNDATAKIWSVSDGECKATLARHGAPITCIALSPDGKYVATGSDDCSVILWSMDTYEFLARIEHTKAITTIVFSPDGSLLATGSEDGGMALWNVPDMSNWKSLNLYPIEFQMELDGTLFEDSVNAISFSPDGGFVASGRSDFSVQIWSVQDGRCCANLQNLKGRINDVEFSPDGKYLAAGVGYQLNPAMTVRYEFSEQRMPANWGRPLKLLGSASFDVLVFVPM